MDDLRFYVPLNSTSVISGRRADDNERLCAVEPRRWLSLHLLPAKEPRTACDLSFFEAERHFCYSDCFWITFVVIFFHYFLFCFSISFWFLSFSFVCVCVCVCVCWGSRGRSSLSLHQNGHLLSL